VPSAPTSSLYVNALYVLLLVETHPLLPAKLQMQKECWQEESSPSLWFPLDHFSHKQTRTASPTFPSLGDQPTGITPPASTLAGEECYFVPSLSTIAYSSLEFLFCYRLFPFLPVFSLFIPMHAVSFPLLYIPPSFISSVHDLVRV